MKSRWRGAHLPIDGGAGGMGDLPAVASGEGWVLPMSDDLTQADVQDAHAMAKIQTPPAIGRCAPILVQADFPLAAARFPTPSSTAR